MIPHLTVADGVGEMTADAIDAEVQPGLPITSRIGRVTLIAQDHAGRWIVVRHWPLG